MNRQTYLAVFVLIVTRFIYVFTEGDALQKGPDSSSLDVVQEKDDRLLVFATIDGTLTAVEQQTGEVKWKIKERPIVQVPLNMTDAIVPVFLPDPRDGSLYLIGDVREPLKKLPFTIPQLVSSSPCRSSDGILYTGKKKDSWFKLDPDTGKKQQILGWDDHSTTCPLDTKKVVYIGRTQYNLRMVDGKKPDTKWNVTLFAYSSNPMSNEELNNYDLVYFTSTSAGRVISLDRRRGSILWDSDFGSPVIGAYLLDTEGLISVPFTSLANHTLSFLVSELLENGLMENPNHMKLYPTLYIGEHSSGLYAFPSLVDQNVVTITSSDTGPLLLGGPHTSEKNKVYREYPLPGHNYRLPSDAYNSDYFNFHSLPNHIIYLGHYNVPRYSTQKLLSVNKDVAFLKDESTQTDKEMCIDDEEKPSANNKKREGIIGYEEILRKESPQPQPKWILTKYISLKTWINQQENKGLKLSLIVMTGCVIAMFWYLQVQVREMQMSQNGSRGSSHSSYGSNNVTAISEELPNGMVKVGKITFHPDQLLGKGCEGTFVYRGEFDSRRVAVKRLLPECFTFADREVALLRESDAHPNVIRYYCMEQDRMFRYIALELCQATLSDYVQGKCNISSINQLDILRQATAGLHHLHSLDIVHRDIKPHNVLISVPDKNGKVKVLISDFGLCKKLQVGRGSFSRRSGVTGTDGWIAPEMLNGSERATYAVDLFSLGCLFYYILSKGSHPFGDSLRRQANILMGKYDLSELKGPDWLTNMQRILISALISSRPEVRPSCEAILEHPLFWGCDKILNFFQEVSDRVEKAEPSDCVLKELENDGEKIVHYDWKAFIHEEVASDLKKYRSYHGNSVRDLLRALRNKKHHYRELSPDAQALLGEDPETFTKYWTDRFPLLLAHTWITMQCVADEEKFKSYYHKSHRYSVKYFKEQMNQYISSNPIERRLSYSDSFKFLEEMENKDTKRLRRSKYTSRTDYQNSPEIPEAKELIKSAGLYRNHNSPEARKGQSKSVYSKNLQVKKIKKKSDEPLVWVINNDK